MKQVKEMRSAILLDLWFLVVALICLLNLVRML